MGLDEEGVARLHDDVEGWAAGLILAAQAGGGEVGPRPSTLPRRSSCASRPLFSGSSSRPRSSTASLLRSPPRSPDATTRPIIRDLVDRHLFTGRLEERAGELPVPPPLPGVPAPARRGAARRRGPGTAPPRGRGALAVGENLDAVPHFLAADDPAGAAAALEPVAESLVTSPQAHSLLEWLDAMPADAWVDSPSLMTARAALLLIRGEHEASFDEFERAIEGLLHLGDHDRAAAALLRFLQSMITAGTRPARRIEAGERYIGPRGPIRAGAARRADPPRIELRVRLRLRPGREPKVDAALALPSAAGRPILSVYADVVRPYYIRSQTGRLEEAIRSLDEAIAELERQEGDDELAFMPYARMFRVYLLNDLGLHEEAQAEIARTIDAAARRGMARTHRRVVAWIWSVAMAGLGRWADLEGELAPPVRSPGQREPTFGQLPLPRSRRRSRRVAGRRRRGGGTRGERARADAGLRARVRQPHGALRPSSGRPTPRDFPSSGSRWRTTHRRIGAEIANPGASRAHSSTWPQRTSAAVGDAALAEALALTERWSFGALWRSRERPTSGALLSRALARNLGPAGPSPARLAAACGAEVFRECVELTEPAPAPVRAQLAEVAGDAANVEASAVERLLRDRDPGVRAAARQSRARLDSRPRPADPHPHARPLLRDARRRPRPGVRLRAPDLARRPRRARSPRARRCIASGSPTGSGPACPRSAAAAALRVALHGPAPRPRARARGERAGLAVVARPTRAASPG